jgi:hypothetical protein
MYTSTARERFRAVLAFERPGDRLPMIEWAAWWNRTLDRWKTEGLPADYSRSDALRHFGLDELEMLAGVARSSECPKPEYHGAGIVADEAGYEAIHECLFTDANIERVVADAKAMKERHERGEICVRLWLDGFFWFPRGILGIERHLYAFYDQPALMHRMNRELAQFNIRLVEALFPVLTPDMVGFAEDMSYNLGPMLSEELFDEFLLPYYREVIPVIKRFDVPVLIDSDGDITSMIPWMERAGIEGVYPLERQAGVDVAFIRERYPRFLMLGGFDKMVMPHGEAAMRSEFERLLPVMRSGGFINSVDHQTPPGVSLENYLIYIKLLEEFCHRAVAP